MKAIITVIGKDKPGIIAGISHELLLANANILDMSQTVMSGNIFVMNMQIDIEGMKVSFDELASALENCGKELALDIRLQRQEIFDVMYHV